MAKNVNTDIVYATSHSFKERELGDRLQKKIEKLKHSNGVEVAWVIQSFSNPDKKYLITKLKNGTWKCTCPMFIFNIPRKKYLHKAYLLPNGQYVCKHIAWVYQNQRLIVPIIDNRGVKKEYNEYAINIVDMDSMEGRIVSTNNTIENITNMEVGMEDVENGRSRVDKFNFSLEDIVFLDEDTARDRIQEKKEKKIDFDLSL